MLIVLGLLVAALGVLISFGEKESFRSGWDVCPAT